MTETDTPETAEEVTFTIYLADPHGEYPPIEAKGMTLRLVIDMDAMDEDWPDDKPTPDQRAEHQALLEAGILAKYHLEDWGDLYELKGSLKGLWECYDNLVARLITPAYDWYGMGGDDHAFDYWPNSMCMARVFAEQLDTLPLDSLMDERDRGRAMQMLKRVYLAVRGRYEREQGYPESAHLHNPPFDDFMENQFEEVKGA